MEGDPSPQRMNLRKQPHRKPISRRHVESNGHFLFPVFS